MIGIIILAFFLLLSILLFALGMGYIKQKFEGPCNWLNALDKILSSGLSNNFICNAISSGGGGTGTSGRYDCSGVSSIKVPDDYKQWVKSASDIYLSGDQAKLIALIQNESSWTINANANTTSALGLGQFLKSTAENMPEFVGGDDKHGTVWLGGCVADQCKTGQTDSRLDPQRSIYAVAHLLNTQLSAHNNNFKDAYVLGYHGGTTDAQKAEAEKGWTRIEGYYNDLITGGQCSAEIAVIPPLPYGNDTCSWEENCQVAYTDGGGWPICQAVVDKLILTEINRTIVNVDNPPKYIYLNIETALESASKSCNKCFTVTSAYRTCAYQDKLKKDGETTQGGGASNHNSGQGVDITGTGDYLCNKEQCSAKLVQLLANYGLIHFNGCGNLSGDYYLPTIAYHDCLHFSDNPKGN